MPSKKHEEQEAIARTAAAAEEAMKERRRRRVEYLRKVELRAKAAAERIAKQRAADNAEKAAMHASSSPASGPTSLWSSGNGRLRARIERIFLIRNGSRISPPSWRPQEKDKPQGTWDPGGETDGD